MIDYMRQMIYSSLVYESRYLFLVEGLTTTLLITFGAFVIGTLMGALFALCLCGRVGWLRRTVGWLTQLFVQIPSLVLLMLFCYVFFANVSASATLLVIVAFAIKTASYLAAIFTSAITAVSEGEAEAARSLGMSAFQAFRYITLPQAIKTALPMYRNQFVATLQDTSIVGYLAIQDLTRASDIIAARTLDPFISLIIVSVSYLLIGWLVSTLLSLLGRERHLGEESA